MNNIIYNIKYEAYLDLLSLIETNFNEYKKLLLEHNIKLHHPSLLQNPPSHSSITTVKSLFLKESEIFGTPLNFLNALIMINYHLGSVLQVSDIKIISKNIDSISISIEDLLIIESFKNL